MPNQYYLDALEPAVFQRLVNALLIGRYGEGIRLLPLRGKDGGRDAETAVGSSYFSVTIPTVSGAINPGPIRPGRYLFQAKHHRMTERPPTTVRSEVLQEFNEEFTNNVLPRLDKEGVDYFFLITNVPSSREIVEKVDERRREFSRIKRELHTEILWLDHLTAWLDQAVPVWPSFPEIFAGGVLPYLGKLASENQSGLPRSIRLAIKTQYVRDSIVRFRQVDLEQRLSRLFVDLDVSINDSRVRFLHRNSMLLEQHALEFQDIGLNSNSLESVFSGAPSDAGALSFLTSKLSGRFSRVVLEGGPGQGKSTLTQMLVQVYRSLLVDPNSEFKPYTHLVDEARFPIRVELRLFAEWLGNSERSVEQYVAELFSKDSGGAQITVEDIHLLARKQNLLLIFDGLDEVGSDSLRDEVVAKISASISRFETDAEADLRAIITSRPPAIAGRLDALSGFARMHLLPLNDRKIDLYTDRWTQVQCSDSNDRERVKTSFDKRKSEAHVAALAKNPMQLSVLLHFIRLKGEAFPDRRAELYREYFKTVIDRDVEKNQDLLRNRADIEALHEFIGFTIHSNAEGNKTAARLKRKQLVHLVRSWFESEGRPTDLAEHLFKIGEERLGLVVALSGEGENTEYGFEIQPIREYFTAAFINDKQEGSAHDLFQMMIRRPFWKEVARFLAGLRRANERADLLSRARELDEDPNDGWRSDGMLITYQLLQEGVLSSPGHVHRDALTFVLSALDPNTKRARYIPEEYAESVPLLIRSCDSDQPGQILKGHLTASRGSKDRGHLRQLWSTCYRTLDRRFLFQEMCSYRADYNIESSIKLLWPTFAGQSYAEQLDKANELARIPDGILAKYWYKAGTKDPELRKLFSTPTIQDLLLEQFAFRGLKNSDPWKPDSSPFAVWQLCGWLYEAAQTVRDRSVLSVQEPTEPDISGLRKKHVAIVMELIDRLTEVAITPHPQKLRKLASFASRLADLIREDGLPGIIAGRCAATFLGYVEGPRRIMYHGDVIWMQERLGPPRRRGEPWTNLKRALLPLYRAAIPEQTDRIGRSNAYRLMNEGFFQDLQSEVFIDGEAQSILSLLNPQRSVEKQAAIDWIKRVPIQQYWLQDSLSEDSVDDILKIVGEQDLEWSGVTLPLSPSHVSLVSQAAKQRRNIAHFASLVFMLTGAKIWGKIKEQTLPKILMADSQVSGHANLLFTRTRYPGEQTPRALLASVHAILKGDLLTHFSVRSAATKFAIEKVPITLAPLRDTGALPSLRKQV
jgi:hypothetical protein